jgi:hypothetical protein
VVGAPGRFACDPPRLGRGAARRPVHADGALGVRGARTVEAECVPLLSNTPPSSGQRLYGFILVRTNCGADGRSILNPFT